MNQKSLFDTSPEPIGYYGQPLSRKSDPETSKVAAEKINVKENEAWVMEWFRRCESENGNEGVTAWELACESDGEVCGNPRLTPDAIYDIIHKRLRGLERKGLIQEMGKRADRIKGSLMLTWRVKK